MNMRSRQINLNTLQSIIDTGIEKFKNIENNECYLIIGNTGLRIPGSRGKKVHNITYLTGGEANIEPKQYFMYPELHKTKENLLLCECPYLDYEGPVGTKDKEVQLCQAISLEIIINMAKRLQGILITIDYNDFYTCRGM